MRTERASQLQVITGQHLWLQDFPLIERAHRESKSAPSHNWTVSLAPGLSPNRTYEQPLHNSSLVFHGEWLDPNVATGPNSTHRESKSAPSHNWTASLAPGLSPNRTCAQREQVSSKSTTGQRLWLQDFPLIERAHRESKSAPSHNWTASLAPGLSPNRTCAQREQVSSKS